MICVNTNYKLSIVLILVIGCASNTMFLPKGVTLDKNQMIYRDNPMGIWTHDWQGKYHHYAPEDSAQYYALTQNFGLLLENAFFGHCKRHSIIEIVNISPELITVMNAPDMSKSSIVNKSSSFDLLQPTINESSMPTQMLSPTHESIQAEKQGDTKK